MSKKVLNKKERMIALGDGVYFFPNSPEVVFRAKARFAHSLKWAARVTKAIQEA